MSGERNKVEIKLHFSFLHLGECHRNFVRHVYSTMVVSLLRSNSRILEAKLRNCIVLCIGFFRGDISHKINDVFREPRK